MKIEHITKLILKFMGGGIVNFPTRFLKWIKVESCDCDGGGDTPSSMNLNDFRNFNIGLIANYYKNAYNPGAIIPIHDFFEVNSMDIFKDLSALGLNTDNESEIIFNVRNLNEDEFYNHRIDIIPRNNEWQILINTDYEHQDEESQEPINERYSALLIVNIDNETLEIVDIGEGGE